MVEEFGSENSCVGVDEDGHCPIFPFSHFPIFPFSSYFQDADARKLSTSATTSTMAQT
jgi:hypothetical protein